MPSDYLLKKQEIRKQTYQSLILDTAIDIIKQVGFFGLHMRDIAKKINLTTPRIYYYFGDIDKIRQWVWNKLTFEYKEKPEELLELLVIDQKEIPK